MDTKECRHKLVKYEGWVGTEENKYGKCIDCKSPININDNYKLIPTGKYDLYRRKDGV